MGETHRLKVAQWRKAHPDEVAKSNFRRRIKRYGLTDEEYRQLVARQKGRCAICGRKELCIDHNHNTGKVRGLLCGRCNAALGLLDDSLEFVLKLGLYLIRAEES
jgi:hypothetical protein